MSGRTTERRQAPRARIAIPIQVTAPSGAAGATLIDISRSGLSCSYPQALPEMTMMGIDLQLGKGAAHHIEGAVVRCEKQRGLTPPSYLVAIYFTELSAAARAAIDGLVHKNLGTAQPTTRAST
jgi:hypothetical protein